MLLAKSSTGTRIAEIALGAMSIALSGFILWNPGETALILVMILGYALIFLGISRIIAGFVQRQASGAVRGISIGTGILSIIGGTIAIFNPIGATAVLIMVVTIFIMIHGFGLIGAGISARGVSKGSRIGMIAMGILAVGLSSVLLAYPGLAIEMIVLYMSISLFFNGIGSIISGIIGQGPKQRELQ